jgi:periplasmic protein CpxP/Spy
MNSRSVILGSVLAASLLGVSATSTVMAASEAGPNDGQRGGYERHGWHREGGLSRMFERLDLTQEQRDKVSQIMDEGKAARQEKMKALWENRKALHEQAMAETYDAQRVQELADQQGKLRAELTVMRTETFHNIYGVLTPEQKQKLVEMKAQRKGQHRGHTDRP